MASIPVPTNGASARTNGTACLCILEPINALFASSFSKKGIKAAATETNCLGETSIRSTPLGSDIIKSPLNLQLTRSLEKLPETSSSAFAWAIV